MTRSPTERELADRLERIADALETDARDVNGAIFEIAEDAEDAARIHEENQDKITFVVRPEGGPTDADTVAQDRALDALPADDREDIVEGGSS